MYSTLGTRIDDVEMLDAMMTGADRDLVKVWEKKNAPRFDNVMLAGANDQINCVLRDVGTFPAMGGGAGLADPGLGLGEILVCRHCPVDQIKELLVAEGLPGGDIR